MTIEERLQRLKELKGLVRDELDKGGVGFRRKVRWFEIP
jgi:hypothetical protein